MYKILIVDDSPNICLITRNILQDIAGWKPLIAASGEEGLAIAQREQPDGILLDIRMPGMDGMIVLEQLKENPETQSIPVILLTGEKISAQTAAQLPISGVISKPFDTGELIERIRLLFNWHK